MNSSRIDRPSRLLALAVFATAAGLVSPAGAADLAHGAQLYKECAGCHAPLRTLMGPPHCGVFGRPSASIAGFEYSDAMKEAHVVWDEKQLHEFLTSPLAHVPGTKMGFAGYFDENDRIDVIEFLKVNRATASEDCQPGSAADLASQKQSVTGQPAAGPAFPGAAPSQDAK